MSSQFIYTVLWTDANSNKPNKNWNRVYKYNTEMRGVIYIYIYNLCRTRSIEMLEVHSEYANAQTISMLHLMASHHWSGSCTWYAPMANMRPPAPAAYHSPRLHDPLVLRHRAWDAQSVKQVIREVLTWPMPDLQELRYPVPVFSSIRTQTRKQRPKQLWSNHGTMGFISHN